MTNITLSIPTHIHSEMKNFSEIKWSEVARNAIIEKIETLKILEKIAAKNSLTKRDIQELSRNIKKQATRKMLNDYNRL